MPKLLYILQTSPCAKNGGLGVSVCMLAPSAFLVSVAATLPLQEAIRSASVAGADDTAVSNIKTMWSCLANTTGPSDLSKHIQRAWDAPVTTSAYNDLMSTSQSPIDHARLEAVVTPHASDCIHAPPLTAAGLWLSNEAIRVAIGYQLETNICQPHTCVCGTTVNARGLHGFVCCKNWPRHIRHSQLNDMIWHAIKKA